MTPRELTIISLWFTTFHVDKKFCLQLFATCATSIIHRNVLCMLWGCLSISFPLSLYTKSNAHWVSTSRPSLSLSHTHTYIKNCGLWTFLSVSMAGKLMHAVQYFGYGGGASGLKVIFIFVVHFCNHHWILSSGFIHVCEKFHDCWLLVFKFQLLDLKKDCSLQIKIIVWGLNSRPISPLYAILCLCFQIILAHHVL